MQIQRPVRNTGWVTGKRTSTLRNFFCALVAMLLTSHISILENVTSPIRADTAISDSISPKRPQNIILVMVDDLGIEGLSCYGAESYKTPHLDQLAAGGIRFTHAYSQPLCTPTRNQIMTGRYNCRNWLYFGILPPEERTFGHLMRTAGYRTCISGKWQLQSYDPPDFPRAELRRGTGMHVDDAGFEQHSLFHSWHTEDKGSRYGDPTLYQNGKLLVKLEGKFGPDMNMDFALKFLKDHKDQPSFIYMPMALPHWPMVPTPHSKDWQDPAKRLNESTDYFPDMVHYMDHLMGRLNQGLKDLGLLEKTLVLFYSDNGTDRKITSRFRGAEVQGGKNQVLQTGIRVPLIASWPGVIKPGQVSDDLIDASDFLITLADLAGIEVPGNWQHDGISFAPRLYGKHGPKREVAFFWYDPRPGWDKSRFNRHIFALDKNYKLFADGKFFKIDGTGFKEEPVTQAAMTEAAIASKRKLQQMIDQVMAGPISPAAKKLVDAYGNEIKS